MTGEFEIRPGDVLLVVDVQNDFCPGGGLAVAEGDRVVPLINRLAGRFDHVVLTQDWHPAGHLSFASSHPDAGPYDTIAMPYGDQTLWPDHCIQGTSGAAFHPDLDTTKATLTIRKGFRREIDSYSAFRENDGKTLTGLAGYLRERAVSRVVICGLALDFCVRWTAEDAVAAGFAAVVVGDGCRPVALPGTVEAANASFRENSIPVVAAAAIPG